MYYGSEKAKLQVDTTRVHPASTKSTKEGTSGARANWAKLQVEKTYDLHGRV